MEKTKMGLSVGIMGAAAYLTATFGGYVAFLVVAGYVLLMEESLWLKKTVVKAFALLLSFSLLSWGINLIPSLFSLLSEFVDLFGGHFYPAFIHNLFNVLAVALTIIKGIVFVYLALLASKEKTCKIPVIEPIIEKAFE